uniref:Uncharacterized protein n=1 Tax=Aegilops tauschii subsp. strangulata TaxID=200361 RepID=A0A453STU8_AEGTS
DGSDSEQRHPGQAGGYVAQLGAGKTSIVVRFAKGLYYECQESTIGAAFFSQALPVSGAGGGEDATVRFDIWDTAGQERYHSLAPMYYRGAAAAVVVYDITSTDSYIRAKRWVDELQRQGFSAHRSKQGTLIW